MGFYISPGLVGITAAAAAAVAAVVATLTKYKRGGREGRAPAILVWTAAGVYAAGFSAVTLARHFAFATCGLDLGYYGNVIYQFGHGRPFVQTLLPADGYLNHCAPLLAAFAPFSHVFQDPAYLLPFQSLTLAAGIPLIYHLARPGRAASWPAALLALGYALSPALHGANLYDFHPRALGVPLALAALLCFRHGRFSLGLLFTALLAAAQDELALHAVGLAFYGGLLSRRRAAGLAAAAALTLYFVFVALWLYPRLTYARGGGAPHYIHYFAGGETISDPTTWWRDVGQYKLGYLAMIILPAAVYVPASGWAMTMLVTPLAVAVVTTAPTTYQLGWQYPLNLLPFVFGAAALGNYRLGDEPGRAPGTAWLVRWGATIAVLLPAAFIPTAAREYYREIGRHLLPGPYELALRDAVKRVPGGAVVAADDRLCPHLAHRPYLYSYYPALDAELPRPCEAALFERRSHTLLEFVALQRRMGKWGLGLASYDGDYAYYARGRDAADPLGLFQAWFGAVEEWQCPEGEGRRVVADPWAGDGRAMAAKGTLGCPPSLSYIYPPGDYRLTFYLRALSEPVRGSVGVELSDPLTGKAVATARCDCDDVADDRYYGLQVPLSAPTPFSLSFTITSDEPFLFDRCVVEGTRFDPEGIRAIAARGYTLRALRTRKEINGSPPR